jgi:hypothetical protein
MRPRVISFFFPLLLLALHTSSAQTPVPTQQTGRTQRLRRNTTCKTAVYARP